MNRDEYKNHFAEQLRHTRETLGMSQKDVAEAAGLPPSHISHYESGKRSPDVYNLYLIQQAFEARMSLMPKIAKALE